MYAVNFCVRERRCTVNLLLWWWTIGRRTIILIKKKTLKSGTICTCVQLRTCRIENSHVIFGGTATGRPWCKTDDMIDWPYCWADFRWSLLIRNIEIINNKADIQGHRPSNHVNHGRKSRSSLFTSCDAYKSEMFSWPLSACLFYLFCMF